MFCCTFAVTQLWHINYSDRFVALTPHISHYLLHFSTCVAGGSQWQNIFGSKESMLQGLWLGLGGKGIRDLAE
jgi:hypothetical protein